MLTNVGYSYKINKKSAKTRMNRALAAITFCGFGIINIEHYILEVLK